MADDKRLNIGKEVDTLRSRVDVHERRIKVMVDIGGFADSATLGKRCLRIEQRLEQAEANVDMLMDVNAMILGAFREHVIDRHNADCVRDNDRDVVFVRKALRRLATWAERFGLRDRQRDVLDAHRDENRLRPRPQVHVTL